MRKPNSLLTLLIVLSFVFLVSLTIFVYYQFHPITKQIIPIDLAIGDYTGINLDKDALHFGTLKPGSTAQRPVYLHADAYDAEISLFVEGIPFVFPENQTIQLHKGEGEAVRLFAVIPLLTQKRAYEGRLIILTKAL